MASRDESLIRLNSSAVLQPLSGLGGRAAGCEHEHRGLGGASARGPVVGREEETGGWLRVEGSEEMSLSEIRPMRLTVLKDQCSWRMQVLRGNF